MMRNTAARTAEQRGGGSVQRWSQHQWALPLKRTSRQRASLFMNRKNHSLEARCERNRGCLICSFLTLPGYLLFYPFLFYMLHGEQLQGTSPRMVPLESSVTSPNKGKSVHYVAWSGIILLRLKKKNLFFVCLLFLFFLGLQQTEPPFFRFSISAGQDATQCAESEEAALPLMGLAVCSVI